MGFLKCQYWKDQPEVKILFDIIYRRQPYSQFASLNIDVLVKLTKFHGLIPFIFYKLKESNNDIIFNNIYLDFKNTYYWNLIRNLRFWKEFLIIKDAFYQRNIAMVPLKGMDILVRFYPYFDMRSMCDIDILIKEDEFPQAERILSELGYQKRLFGLKEEYWRNKQCHIAFFKGPITVELHFNLDFKRKYTRRTLLPYLWQRTQVYNVQNQKIRLLSSEDAVFCFALHLRHFGNILSLKQVLDVARIIKETPNFDWDYMLKEAQQNRINATLYFILMQVELFTETEIPRFIFQKLKLACWQKNLIKKFLLRYTFANKIPLKQIYLRAHFLLYDNLLESIYYLLNIPYEQFCKFYGLKFYSLQADFLYAIRFFYFPFKQVISLLKSSKNN
ncbi:MAG: nucleotidyltransferase family protein [Candidatus Omnitrophica bacterium]|nr:nucleotidyltransferase family protein [Candidatus Omnitrophota bacterium]